MSVKKDEGALSRMRRWGPSGRRGAGEVAEITSLLRSARYTTLSKEGHKRLGTLLRRDTLRVCSLLDEAVTKEALDLLGQARPTGKKVVAYDANVSAVATFAYDNHGRDVLLDVPTETIRGTLEDRSGILGDDEVARTLHEDGFHGTLGDLLHVSDLLVERT